MANVYLAQDFKDDSNVALKVLKPELALSSAPNDGRHRGRVCVVRCCRWLGSSPEGQWLVHQRRLRTRTEALVSAPPSHVLLGANRSEPACS